MRALRGPERHSDGLSGVWWVKPLPRPVQARRWKFFWIAVWGVILGVDGWRALKRDGSTLSNFLSTVFGTETANGKWRFRIALIILDRHICK